MSAALDKAIDELGAEEQADGRYAYFDDGMRRWYLVSESDLESYASDYLASDDEVIASDAYSHWCAGTVAEEMPLGWEPGAVLSGPALVDAYRASFDRKERRALRTRVVEYYRSAVVRLVAGTDGTSDCRREATQVGLIGIWYALESFDGKGPFEEHALACALRQVQKFLDGRVPS